MFARVSGIIVELVMPSLAYGKLHTTPPKRFAYLTCQALSESTVRRLFDDL